MGIQEYQLVTAIDGLALAAANLGDPSSAVTILTATRAWQLRSHHVRHPVEDVAIERCLKAASRGLPSTTLSGATARGQELTLGGALDLALTVCRSA
jgi:hypothetical protein